MVNINSFINSLCAMLSLCVVGAGVRRRAVTRDLYPRVVVPSLLCVKKGPLRLLHTLMPSTSAYYRFFKENVIILLEHVLSKRLFTLWGQWKLGYCVASTFVYLSHSFVCRSNKSRSLICCAQLPVTCALACRQTLYNAKRK